MGKGNVHIQIIWWSYLIEFLCGGWEMENKGKMSSKKLREYQLKVLYRLR